MENIVRKGEIACNNCFSTWVKNTVEKGKIARYEQFLLFRQCFQKTPTADTYNPGLVWEFLLFSQCVSQPQ